SKGVLAIHRCCNGIAGARKGHEECITLRTDLITMMSTKSLTQQLTTFDQYACVALPKLLKQMRRPLNVSEEQRDGSRRQVTHTCSPLPRFIGKREGRGLSHSIILD